MEPDQGLEDGMSTEYRAAMEGNMLEVLHATNTCSTTSHPNEIIGKLHGE